MEFARLQKYIDFALQKYIDFAVEKKVYFRYVFLVLLAI